ncbi:MAG: TonB-dependent receptor [Fidelibacterota bacterium]|nr:MAG: TonB-dependent receptor [Candidatus Neomarinimicrobiota bacterium]
MKLIEVFCFISLIGAATTAVGQTGTIAGRIQTADKREPVLGANVMLMGTNLGATTDQDGFYIITNVSPGTYHLQASFVGYVRTTVEDVRVLLNYTTTINFELKEEVLKGEEITVVADHQNIKHDISANLADLDAESLQSLPIATIEDAIWLQAGIEPDLSIRGGNINTASFLVDGVNLREGRTNAPIIGLSYTALEQMQVQTGGFNAEHGNIRSGLVQIVTKNPPPDHYVADLFIRHRPSQRLNFNSKEAPTSAGSTVQGNHAIDGPGYVLDMTIGGPMIPPASQSLGNLRFLASYRQKVEPYLEAYDRAERFDRTWQLKLVSDIKSDLKLTLTGLYGNLRGVADSTASMMQGGIPAYPWGFDNDLFQREGLFKNNNIGLSDIDHSLLAATLGHSLNANTFYEIKLHRLGSKYFLRPGQQGSIIDRDTSRATVWSGKIDITNQLNNHTQFKSGVEYIFSNYNITSEVNDACSTRITALGSASGMLCEEGGSPFRIIESWTATPHQGAAYMQSKIELNGSILNLGVRLDYFYPGGNRYIFDDFNEYFSAEDPQTRDDSLTTEAAERQFALSPRLGVSFPVTPNSKLYFNYGHFYQMPLAQYLYTLQQKSFTANLSSIVAIGDPNILMPRTVSYELGYDHNLFDQYLLRIAGYLKDVDRQTSFRVFVSDFVKYTLALPLNYNDASGWELTFSKVKGDWIRGFVNYTYMSFSSGNFGPAAVIRNPLDRLEYDPITQDHYRNKAASQPYARFNLEFLTPSQLGPQLFCLKPLSDWRLDLLGEWRAGKIITWSGPIVDEYPMTFGFQYTPNPILRNNLRMRDFYRLDMRLVKKVKTRFGSMQFFVDINNLLNLKFMYFERPFVTSAGNPFADYNDYMTSLHLPEDTFGDLADDDEFYRFIPGKDRPGDFREADVAFVPIHIIENAWRLPSEPPRSWGEGPNLVYIHDTATYVQFADGAWHDADPEWVSQVLDDKAYINMPDKSHQTFLNPRSISFGIRFSF